MTHHQQIYLVVQQLCYLHKMVQFHQKSGIMIQILRIITISQQRCILKTKVSKYQLNGNVRMILKKKKIKIYKNYKYNHKINYHINGITNHQLQLIKKLIKKMKRKMNNKIMNKLSQKMIKLNNIYNKQVFKVLMELKKNSKHQVNSLKIYVVIMLSNKHFLIKTN